MADKKFTNEWEIIEPEFITVIRCPACGSVILPDFATCVNPDCTVEIKHHVNSVIDSTYYARNYDN